jgi:uncharacterized protein YgbK (DUF1537 family)
MDITKISQGIKSISTPKPGKIVGNREKFSLGESATVQQIQAPSGIYLTPIDALFLNLDERRKGHRQAIEKTTQILNQLDSLRMGIISGSISRETLQDISTLLQTHSQTIIEEPLRTLILEVETRAKVELAKLKKT